MSKYYNPEIILNMTDLDNQDPSVYMITTNRSAGKTTSFIKLAFELFRDEHLKTALIYRYQYELISAAAIFNGVMKIDNEFEGEITAVSHARGLFYEFLWNGVSFAFAMALTNVDALKKYSPMFSEVYYNIMDEFQKEDGKYLPNEVQKLQSLLITIARGGGEQSRPIKVFLLGNNISMLNPYFIFFDVNRRFKQGTKFIRGHGWIAEFTYNESASAAIKQNGIYRAFEKSDYMKTSADNKKLFREDEFMEKCAGKAKYLFTIKHDGKFWGVREELSSGKTFITDNYDKTCKNILVFTSGDHATNTVMINKHSFIMKRLKESYQLGLLRFANLNAKNIIYDILALDFTK